MSYEYTWSFKLNISNILFLFAGIMINILGNSLTYMLGAPVRLDSIGTIFCACLLGPFGGCIAGIAGTVLCHLHAPALWFYAIISIPISVCISILYQRTKIHNLYQLACASVITTIISTVISVPLNFWLRHGYLDNIWGNALITMLLQSGNGFFFSGILGQLFIELPDKVISVTIAILLIKLLTVIEQHYKGGETRQ